MQLPRQSPRALADAVRWAASVLESETQAEDEATGSPEGCSITVLTEAGETEDAWGSFGLRIPKNMVEVKWVEPR